MNSTPRSQSSNCLYLNEGKQKSVVFGSARSAFTPVVAKHTETRSSICYYENQGNAPCLISNSISNLFSIGSIANEFSKIVDANIQSISIHKSLLDLSQLNSNFNNHRYVFAQPRNCIEPQAQRKRPAEQRPTSNLTLSHKKQRINESGDSLPSHIDQLSKQIDELDLNSSDLVSLLQTNAKKCSKNLTFNKKVIKLHEIPASANCLTFVSTFQLELYEISEKVSFLIETESSNPFQFMFGCHRMSLRSNSLRFYIKDINKDKSCYSFRPTLSVTILGEENLLTQRTEFVKQRGRGVCLGEIEYDEFEKGEYDYYELSTPSWTNNSQSDSTRADEDWDMVIDSGSSSIWEGCAFKIQRKIQFTLKIELQINKSALKMRARKNINFTLKH